MDLLDNVSRNRNEDKSENEEEPMKKRVKPKCVGHAKDFCDNTTCHGIRYSMDYDISYAERILFIVACILCLIGVLHFARKTYIKWDEQPVFTTVSPIPSNITEIPFPAITICNMDQVVNEKMRFYKDDPEKKKLADYICLEKSIYNFNEDTLNGSIEEDNFKVDWRTFRKFLKNVTHPCSELILFCSFGGVVLDCEFQPTVSDGGQCCTFNSFHPKYLFKQSIKDYYFDKQEQDERDEEEETDALWTPEKGYLFETTPDDLEKDYYPWPAQGTGIGLGLTLILDSKTKDHYCSSSYCNGFYVAVHNPVENVLAREIGIAVQPGTENRIRLTAEMHKASADIIKYPTEKRRCYFSEENKLEKYKIFTMKNCLIECEAVWLNLQCNCIHYYMPPLENVSICDNSHLSCVRSNSNFACADVCLPGCHDLLYRQELTSTKLNNMAKISNKNKILNNLTSQYVRDNIAVLHFYYKESIFYPFTKDEYIGLTDFLSNIGGLLGLFLGVSCVTLVEVMYYFGIRPGFLQYRYKKNRSK